MELFKQITGVLTAISMLEGGSFLVLILVCLKAVKLYCAYLPTKGLLVSPMKYACKYFIKNIQLILFTLILILPYLVE